MIEQAHYLKEVREQYEDYPYPPHDPELEKTTIIPTASDFLDEINFYCFEGKQSFKDNFRVLVAGGGTGDATIFLAEQLYDYGAEIVHLDISTASIKVAQQRAEIRKLNNITWVHESLLSLADLDIGTFDYINCCGVLHHLEDPAAGLKALTSVLKDDGAMAIMLYGKYGRAGIYQMQELMRLVKSDTDDIQTHINDCKTILDSLPSTNWFKRSEDWFSDHKNFGDIGVYDLFLHSQDIPFSVPDIYQLLETSGLHLRSFIEMRGIGKIIYSPFTYIKDPHVREMVAALPDASQHAIAELTNGGLKRHTFYVSKKPKIMPSIEDKNMTPFFANAIGGKSVFEQICAYVSQAIAQSTSSSIEIVLSNHGVKQKTVIVTCEYTELILKHFDGTHTIGQIYDAIAEENGDKTNIEAQIKAIYDALHLYDWVYLRDAATGNHKLLKEIQQATIERRRDTS